MGKSVFDPRLHQILYKVLEEYDCEKKYKKKVKIQNKVGLMLASFKKNEVLKIQDVAKHHYYNKTDLATPKYKGTEKLVADAISCGRSLGIIEQIHTEKMPFKEFLSLPTVQYFAKQLKGRKLINIKTNGSPSSTNKKYLYLIWHFNEWIIDKRFTFTRTRRVSEDTIKVEKSTEKIKNLEHFLKLYQDATDPKIEFVKLVKSYLLDDANKDKSAQAMKLTSYAIKAYFERNESPIIYKFDPKALHKTYDNVSDNATLSLIDLYEILAHGRASVLDKAVVLCRFQRGLDTSTFVDRFNFEAFEQISDYFGTTDYESWDTSKCPIPITLTRIKTSYTHRGFIDIDALVAIKKYLKFRIQRYQRPMRKGEPMFLNRNGHPISINWMAKVVPRLAKNAGIQNYLASGRTEKNGHELRDLLKSTLISCGTMQYVCELAIGHKVGDSYEKQDKLYPEKTRYEYMKASKQINIMTQLTNFLKEGSKSQALEKEVEMVKRESQLRADKLESRLERMQQEKVDSIKAILDTILADKKEDLIKLIIRKYKEQN